MTKKEARSFLDKITAVRPSRRQIVWQEMEFYGFIHYGINSFMNQEWGTGKENPQIFNPKSLDTDQWCESLVRAGMTGVIMTAKHHDGFCLWDTKSTNHSVMYSPYGKDILAQLSDSCRKFGLKIGIYLSPWDQYEPCYGQGQAYDDFFCKQLTELLQGYGELFCLWFDGACGEGPNGKIQHYDWERYYALIRKHQPEAVISVCGPDVRWCGNEGGYCRHSEWSVVPASMKDNEKIQQQSQQVDDVEFRQRIPSDSEDLGSREILAAYEDFIWYPAEVNTSIRPGWFYHEAEDTCLRTLDNLKSIYLESVGGNATFLLNVPPHYEGYIAAGDVQRLEEMGNWLRTSFSNNLLAQATYQASSAVIGREASNINQPNAFWKSTAEDESSVIIVKTKKKVTPHYLMLQEEITLGQRIEAFTLSYWQAGSWIVACQGTVVGYKCIRPIESQASSNKWKLEISSCRLGSTLKTFHLY
jgi:alpha-L-fucosidase